MAAPTFKVQFAPGSTWSTEPGSRTWKDITSRVLDRKQRIRIRRGRSSALESFRAGTVELLCKNDDRALDPEHATGPYAGALLPGVPLRVVGTVAGVDYPVALAHIDDYPQRFDRNDFQLTTPIRATDGLEKLARANLPSVYAQEVVADIPRGWWRLDETIGPTLADSSGNRFNGDYGATTLDTADHPGPYEAGKAQHFNLNSPAPQVVDNNARLTALPFTIEGVFTVDPTAIDPPPLTGYAMTYFRQGGDDFDIWAYAGIWFLASGCQFIAATNASGAPVVRATGTGLADKYEAAQLAGWGTIHMAARFSVGGAIGIYLNGVFQTLYNPSGGNGEKERVIYVGSNPVTPWQGVVADVATYPQLLSNVRISARVAAIQAPRYGELPGARISWLLDRIGWPAGLRDISVGNSILGPVRLDDSALEVLRKIEAAEQGAVFVDRAGKLVFRARHFSLSAPSSITFADDGTTTPFASWERDSGGQMISNRIKASRDGGGTVNVEDATSRQRHGPIDDRADLRNLPLATDAQVQSLVEFRLASNKDPHPRVPKVRIPLHSPKVDAAAVLSLDLGDVVTFKSVYGGGDPVVIIEAIDGIEHDIGAGEWWVTLSGSPVQPIDVFVLDQSLLDGPDVLTF